MRHASVAAPRWNIGFNLGNRQTIASNQNTKRYKTETKIEKDKLFLEYNVNYRNQNTNKIA
jgi:hypothetical protein